MSKLESSEKLSAESATNNNSQCPICLEALILETQKITKCQHTFCMSCLDKWLETNHTCPMCRTELNEPDVKQNNLDSQQFIYTIPWAVRPNDIMIPNAVHNVSRIDRIPQIRLEFRT